MSPTPPSTTSSNSGGHSPDAQFRVVRKRNRVPLSCGPCRHRKLKCNRTHPCENCVRRGDASSCSYAAPGSRKKNQSQGATPPDDMQNRIDRLEGLVLSLMTNGAQSAGPAAAAQAIFKTQSDSTGSFESPVELDREEGDMIKEEEEDPDDSSEVEGVTSSLGLLKVDADKGKSFYWGDSHWHNVLADIAEVRNYFSVHKTELEKNYEKIRNQKPSTAIDGPAFLFSNHAPATEEELRGEVPTKSAVDKLVTRYFNSYDPAAHILHSPTFHKELRKHWQDPAKTPIVWLGLLYSILTLAMQSYNQIGDEPLEWKGRTLDLAGEYRLRTVQCLVNLDYTKSSLYTIETLIFYVQGEFGSRFDAEVGIWLIVGMIVRLAMRMGYHRDPSNYPNITPYQGEMRRRIWMFIRQMDTMFSFQLALPGMIRSTYCDTVLPRNIFEDEFGPESKVLPPARPKTEPTPISYLILKSHIASEFGTIVEDVNAVNAKSISYDEILKRDNRLRELKINMPPHLRLRPLEECLHDPAILLMQRFNVDIFWQKTIVVLHRKYITRARQNPRYAHSRRSCVDASIEILRHQIKLNRESKAGGRMRAMKWYISALTKSDYLLGAMIVCLELYYDKVSESMADPPANYDPYFWTPTQREEMLSLIESTFEIWNESAGVSMEAFKASRIMHVMIEKLKCPTEATPEQQPAPTTNQVFAQFDDENLRPEHSAAMTLGMLSGGLTPNSAAFMNGMGQSPSAMGYMADTNMRDSSGGTGLTPGFQVDNPFASMNSGTSPFAVFGNAGVGAGTGAVGGLMDVPVNLDWEAWDTFVQNGGNIDPNFTYYPTNTEQQPNLSPQDGSQQDSTQQFDNNIFMGASGNTPGR